MNQDNEQFFREARKHLEEYIRMRYDLAKLQLAENTAKVLATLLSVMLLSFFALLVLLLTSVLAGFFLSNITGSYVTGFSVIAGFYLLVLFLGFAFRKSLMERPMMNHLIKKFFAHHD